MRGGRPSGGIVELVDRNEWGLSLEVREGVREMGGEGEVREWGEREEVRERERRMANGGMVR